MNNTNPIRPLVLLDVDGVINDLDALVGVARPWEATVVASNGFGVLIPNFMPDLIQRLTETCEVWWCTTWRDRANNEIAQHLGIKPLPVVTDGSQSRWVDWKASAARDLVTAALADGRPVHWIEDFYGRPPVDELPSGVVYVDTTTGEFSCVLTEGDLPDELRSVVSDGSGTPVAATENTR